MIEHFNAPLLATLTRALNRTMPNILALSLASSRQKIATSVFW